MLDDPIVEEGRKVRRAHAKKFNYDLKAIAADLQAQQAAGERKLVVLAPRQPQPVTAQRRAEPVIVHQAG
jgi:hypothetical protein